MAFRDTVERLRRERTEPMRSADLVSAWRAEVSRLYDDIAEWLLPYTDDGGIQLERHAKAASEESLGSYEIDQLDIVVGREIVRLDPQGTMVIGARGRIDMSHLGSGDPRVLVLTGDEAAPAWHLVDRTSRTRLTPLTKESLEAALEGLLEEYGLRAGSAM
ncbi:hypothetical protein [Methylobacterium sp. ID0610]|uniref:hypothetical protein n=1 Tax=Methylobacterium carpenticola TaxID=3344827 RepID=UPI0036A4618B